MAFQVFKTWGHMDPTNKFVRFVEKKRKICSFAMGVLQKAATNAGKDLGDMSRMRIVVVIAFAI